jgi:hypothetical protein
MSVTDELQTQGKGEMILSPQTIMGSSRIVEMLSEHQILKGTTQVFITPMLYIANT